MSAACSTVCGGAFVSDGGSTTADVEFIMIKEERTAVIMKSTVLKKKLVSLLIATAMIPAMILSGCSGSSDSKKDMDDDEEEISETTEEAGSETEQTGDVQETESHETDTSETTTPQTEPSADDQPVTIDVYPFGDEIEDHDGPIVGSVPDGRYFGYILGVSEDGRYACLSLGHNIEITEDEFNAYAVGDTLQYARYEDGSDVVTLTVTRVYEADWGHEVEFDDYDIPSFAQGSYAAVSSDYVLMEESDNPVVCDLCVCILPLSDDCDISDTYEYLLNFDGDDAVAGYETWAAEQTSGGITASSYWYYETEYTDYYDLSDGWYRIGGLVYPLTIENGQITSMSIEWR